MKTGDVLPNGNTLVKFAIGFESGVLVAQSDNGQYVCHKFRPDDLSSTYGGVYGHFDVANDSFNERVKGLL